MKKLFFLLLFINTFLLFSQKTTTVFQSTILKSQREITIGLPLSYKKDIQKKYPLVLLLDGQYLFDPFQGVVNYASYWDDIPEVIIVGINQEKERNSDCEYDEKTNLLIKNGAKFYDFINQELIPDLENKYRLTPFKIIAGHDSTAGFLNYFLYEDKPVFNAFISLSPELVPDMENQIFERLSTTKRTLFYYQSIAGNDLKEDRNQNIQLDKNIREATNPLLNYKSEDFKNASHYSVVLNSIPNALYQIFSSYEPISTQEYQEKIAILSKNQANYLIKKYDAIEKTYGIKMKVRLNDFKAIESAIIKNNNYDEFEKLAQISGEQYPESMLNDYHLATYYEKRGNIKRAFKIYQSAIAKDKMRDLTKEMMMNKVDDLKRFLPKSGKPTKEIIENQTEEKKP